MALIVAAVLVVSNANGEPPGGQRTSKALTTSAPSPPAASSGPAPWARFRLVLLIVGLIVGAVLLGVVGLA
jgi:hypothetical protein